MNEPSHYANYLKALRDVQTVERLRDRRVAAQAAKGPLYEELERRLELLAAEEQDVALEAGAGAREHLQGAREAMAGVQVVAWLDLVDESGISDVIKSGRLETVRAHHGSAHTRLEQFRAACAGVLSVDLPEQDTFLRDGPGRWLQAFDWADNLFAEVSVLSAVQRSTKGLDASLAAIARAMDALGRLRDEVESELGLAEAGFEALMRDAAAPSSTR